MKSSETDGQDASASAFISRWLRPEYRQPDRSANQTAQQGAPKALGRQADVVLEAAPLAGSKIPQATQWPATHAGNPGGAGSGAQRGSGRKGALARVIAGLGHNANATQRREFASDGILKEPAAPTA